MTSGEINRLQQVIEASSVAVERAGAVPYRHRRKRPRDRKSINHKFTLGGCEVYMIVGLYNDGQPGELFFRVAKAGSTMQGLLDSYAIAVSFALQYGAPLDKLCDKFEGQSFEPQDFRATSIMDYVFKWLRAHFIQ